MDDGGWSASGVTGPVSYGGVGASDLWYPFEVCCCERVEVSGVTVWCVAEVSCGGVVVSDAAE